jgi:ATP/maltotriose-dependent transcriptional regulator MalT
MLLAGGCVSAPDSVDPLLAQGEQLLRVGVAAYGESDYATAASMFGKALTHYQSIDYAEGILTSRVNLAELSLAMGNADGVRHQLAAIDSLELLPAGSGQADRLRLLRAGLAISDGDPDAAEAWLTPLLEAGPAPADRVYLVALANRVQVELLRDSGRETVWIDRLQDGLADQPSPDAVLLGRLRRYQAEVAMNAGMPDEAEALLREAYDQYQSIHYRPGIAASLEALGRLAMARGETDPAVDRLRRALRIRTRLLDRKASLAILADLERAYLASGDAAGVREVATLRELLQEAGTEDWRRLPVISPGLETG